METATINYTINTLPKTKKEIVERLFKEGHINLDEVLELMKETSVQVIPTTPPYVPGFDPYWYTSPSVEFGNSCVGDKSVVARGLINPDKSIKE